MYFSFPQLFVFLLDVLSVAVFVIMYVLEYIKGWVNESLCDS